MRKRRNAILLKKMLPTCMQKHAKLSSWPLKSTPAYVANYFIYVYTYRNLFHMSFLRSFKSKRPPLNTISDSVLLVFQIFVMLMQL